MKLAGTSQFSAPEKRDLVISAGKLLLRKIKGLPYVLDT
jgi:hypothetical protein